MRPLNDGFGVTTKEKEQREHWEALRGTLLHVAREAMPATEENEVYVADLIGMNVVHIDGRSFGKVKSVQNFGADDMLEITPTAGGPTWYLPFTKAAVPDLHIADGWLLAVRPVEVGEREPD